jgi:uncharacterized protein (TIGR02611 family)
MAPHPSDDELARWDLDHDGAVTDADLAAAPVPAGWARLGLRGPAIVLRWFTRNAKRLAVLVLGGAVMLAGLAMLVLPGPGVLIVIVGLAILATEFAWAERALDATAGRAGRAVASVSANPAGRRLLALSGGVLVLGGIVVTLLLPAWRLVGLSVALAGAIALGTLHPAVHRWLDGRQRRTAEEPDAP